MTDQELLEWGREESERRKLDLDIWPRRGLRQAQINAKNRRRAAGLSREEAARAVILATRKVPRGAA